MTRKTNGKDYYSHCIYIEKTNELFGRNEKPLKPEKYFKEEPYTMEDSYYLEDAMNRLGEIEDLEEELGCPFEVVFKAMTMGIIVKNHEDLIEIGYSDRKDKYVYFSTEEIYFKNWQTHGIEKTTNCFQITYGDDGEWCVYLKDYQKNWWLKGEKNV